MVLNLYEALQDRIGLLVTLDEATNILPDYELSQFDSHLFSTFAIIIIIRCVCGQFEAVSVTMTQFTKK